MGKLIAVVGSTGVGKTAFVKALAASGNFSLGLEEHEERPYQLKFSRNPKYAFHNQPCQSIPLRFDFARTFEHKGLIPQAAIRMGYGNFLPRSPRRKIKDIIVP